MSALNYQTTTRSAHAGSQKVPEKEIKPDCLDSPHSFFSGLFSHTGNNVQADSEKSHFMSFSEAALHRCVAPIYNLMVVILHHYFRL